MEFALLRFEWIIIGIIVLLLISKLTDFDQKDYFIPIVNFLLLLNVLAGLMPMPSGEAFGHFFRTNLSVVFQKNLLNLALLLISILGREWLNKTSLKSEHYILLLTSILGIFLMLSSNHILPFYLGIEMSTIPLAALANFESSSQKSSEAGIKLILSSAFATAIMLFGISLLYGSSGELYFGALASSLHLQPLHLAAFVFFITGVFFKLSVVPFHLWTADVYEGAPTSVTNYLASVSKVAIVFVLFNIFFRIFGQLTQAWMLVIAILSVLSMTIGNLFALRQENIKRLLAFSSITQVGYILVAYIGFSPHSYGAVLYFVIVYLLSNITAFGVVGKVENVYGSNSLKSFKGLYQQSPANALFMSTALFSLAGIPPTAGFFGKIFLLTAGIHPMFYWVLAIAGANLILSLYNYLRIVRVMFIDNNEYSESQFSSDALYFWSMTITTLLIFALSFIPGIYSFGITWFNFIR
ncbi:MAG: NADH-quinone oxidoreductase subunit N [Bacteroidales bacterium]|nr:NADH-quinone oxidoreductase subunit N [Bacteroidales bacterium]